MLDIPEGNYMFKNEPLIDFAVQKNRESFSAALDEFEKKRAEKLLFACPLIDGKEIHEGRKITRVDPSAIDIQIGNCVYATSAHADKALASVSHGFSSWRKTSVQNRAAIVRRAAQLMREKKLSLSALIIREAGKPWREADADVAEAIDFCEYYAGEIERIAPPKKTMEVPGEDNLYLYEPRGVAVVISPWNFPLAIACGMTVAALVAGNTVILKPAEQTSHIGYAFANILLESGVPGDAFAFLPGEGEEIGRFLVKDTRVHLIAFTGSRSVGLEILSEAAKVHPGQEHIKKVILELGGKNAIIVDEDADLDEAVKGVLQSAFGYSGQKCSACSRVIVVGEAYETFLARLKDAAGDIISGEAREAHTFLGPVIDEEARARIVRTVVEAEKHATVLFKGEVSSDGFFVPPVIFRDVDTALSLWKEEIFGPVVAIRKVATFEEAVATATNSAYALTGGVFSRSPKNIEHARKEFLVGNLYLNRGCTGALVCRQPFGGFKMSGIGSKAGGSDYLLQFVEPRTITENTMRRGFTPETK